MPPNCSFHLLLGSMIQCTIKDSHQRKLHLHTLKRPRTRASSTSRAILTREMTLEELKMGAALTTMELMDVVGNTLIKAAQNKDNVSNLVFIVYSHALGSLFLAPVAFLFHRTDVDNSRGPLTPPSVSSPNSSFVGRGQRIKTRLVSCFVVVRLLAIEVASSEAHLLNFLEAASSYLLENRCDISYGCILSMYAGLGYASPTLASAMGNLYPAYTFGLAIIFRMEAVDLRVMSSLLKVIGTLVSICGAFVVTFYKGMPINLHFPSKSPPQLQPLSSATNWVIGGLFLALSYIFIAFIAILKTWVLRDYPSALLVMLITCSVETIMAATVALILEDPSTWTLSFDIELVAIFYAAIMGVGVINTVQCWALHKRGPVYVAMFKPLQMIIAAVLGIVFLGDTLHLGSVIGGATIAAGFYTVMQGKAKEIAKDKDGEISNSEPSPDHAALLANKSIDP
ncbi:WAT1-related protein [Drosera capensis]